MTYSDLKGKYVCVYCILKQIGHYRLSVKISLGRFRVIVNWSTPSISVVCYSFSHNSPCMVQMEWVVFSLTGWGHYLLCIWGWIFFQYKMQTYLRMLYVMFGVAEPTLLYDCLILFTWKFNVHIRLYLIWPWYDLQWSERKMHLTFVCRATCSEHNRINIGLLRISLYFPYTVSCDMQARY